LNDSNLAKNDHIRISMTENEDSYENALAERMNMTLKEEFGLRQILATKTQAKILVEQAVNIYNNYRPHLSLKMQTPNSIYKQKSQLFA